MKRAWTLYSIFIALLVVMPSSAKAYDAVDYASTQIGKGYLLGATGPSQWDCSSLVQWAYLQVGVSLHRVTFDQVNDGPHVGRTSLQRGDLVFFQTLTDPRGPATHVGIFVGGNTMIDANSYANRVTYDNLDDSYWKPIFLFGVRVSSPPPPAVQQGVSNPEPL